MPIDKQYLDYIIDQLSEFGEFSHKKMFGGVGFFREKIFFAGIMDGVFRLKVDDENRADFEAYGMEPWGREGSTMRMPYYEVPEEIVADKEKLAEWTEKAFAVALRINEEKGKKGK
jgi:DNA transformation protein